jgi:pimeloyl-ACP methyl ester carboxylesterase
MRFLFSLLVLLCISSGAVAQADDFKYIGTQTKQQLNQILVAERASFLPKSHTEKNYHFPKFTPAKYDVDIYKVSYPSSISIFNNKPTIASGMIAIPKIDRVSSLPFLSYQHGTVYGKYEVPSYAFLKTNPSGYPQYDGAYETRLMVAQYAAQGYVVMAADYFGMGDSAEPEAYMVKSSLQQACADFYDVSVQFLAGKGIQQKNLFLAGWSEGGWATTAFLEKLESRGTTVKAAITASSPNDPFAALTGLTYNPRQIDAMWSNSILALTVFAYQQYYAKPDLANSVLNPKYYDSFRKIYQRDYANFDELVKIFQSINPTPVPFKDYLRSEYADANYLLKSEYGQILLKEESYRQLFKAPVRMYYGTRDEVIAIPVGQLGAFYQTTMGNYTTVAIPVEGGSHRGTFLVAAAKSKGWFDRFNQKTEH